MGDQMQLAAPSEGSHPGRSGLSCLEYLLGGVAVVPPGRGLFLPTTHRLHPALCAPISELVCAGRPPRPANSRWLLTSSHLADPRDVTRRPHTRSQDDASTAVSGTTTACCRTRARRGERSRCHPSPTRARARALRARPRTLVAAAMASGRALPASCPSLSRTRATRSRARRRPTQCARSSMSSSAARG